MEIHISTYPDGESKEKIKLGVGYDSTRTFLKENTKISDQILKEIKKVYRGSLMY